MENTFKVGDKVTIIRQVLSGSIKEINFVKRVLKPYIELNDGSKWSHDGRQYPRSNRYGWNSPRLEHTTDQHLIDIERDELLCRVLDKLDKLKYHNTELTLEQLKTLDGAVPTFEDKNG